jgi:hypothetical protein
VEGSSRIDNDESALLFTIYAAALSSMPSTDAKSYDNVPKHAAIAAYRGATEHALARANLTTTGKLTTLQAFVLHLSLNRFTDDAKRVWALTALASRLCSGQQANISPFAQEMRKRLRWELWYLDHRAHQDIGQGSAPPGTNQLPDLPVNAKDAHISPAMMTPPRLCHEWTEIAFSLIQFEIATTAHMVGATSQLRSKEAIIDACEERIFSTYLRHCDGTEPIHWLARHVARVLLLELRLRIHSRQHIVLANHPLDLSHPCQDQLFLAAVDVLDSQRIIDKDPEAAQWSWLLAGYKKFWPLSFVLAELCYLPGSAAVDRAWEVATTAYGRWEKDDMNTTHAGILSQLMYRAQVARGTAVSAEQSLWWNQVFEDVTESPEDNYVSLSELPGQRHWDVNLNFFFPFPVKLQALSREF